jgi:hypothetical protein
VSNRTRWLLLLIGIIALATIVCPRRVNSQTLIIAEAKDRHSETETVRGHREAPGNSATWGLGDLT